MRGGGSSTRKGKRAKRLAPGEVAGTRRVGALVPTAHGKGYASEAVAAALAWADRHVDAPKQVCIISPGNAASIRVAEKFGFRERVRTTYHGADTIQFERLRHG